MGQDVSTTTAGINREAVRESIRDGVQRLISNIKSVIYVDTKKLEYIIASKIAAPI